MAVALLYFIAVESLVFVVVIINQIELPKETKEDIHKPEIEKKGNKN